MKKLLILSLALLFCLGVAEATNIPQVVQPASSGEKWITSVYLSGSTDVDEGDVLIWAIDASTGDDYMYVALTTTEGTGPIAGVANEAITAGEIGSITVWGLTDVDTVTDSNVALDEGCIMTTSGTSGAVQQSDSTGLNYYLGFSMGPSADGSTPVFVCPGVERN